jgi:hypothetical protein
MRLLLDTHTLLWFPAGDPKLSATANAAIEDPANERWLSPISLLEIALQRFSPDSRCGNASCRRRARGLRPLPTISDLGLLMPPSCSCAEPAS